MIDKNSEMEKAFIMVVLLVIFTGCVSEDQNNNNQTYENTIQDESYEVEKELPAVESKPNFSLAIHPLQLSNPLWKMPIKFNLSVEKGIDSYRGNITIKAFYAALYELQNMTSLSFNEVSLEEAQLVVEINTSLKHVKAEALGVSMIEKYIPHQDYNEIVKARIILTPIYSCAAKIEALHELLHTLGFDHSRETNSIMYEYGAVCTSKVTSSIRQTLSALYN